MASFVIKSWQHPRVQSAARLRQRRNRLEQGRTLVGGFLDIQRSVDAGIPPSEVFVSESVLSDRETAEQIEALFHLSAQITSVSAETFERIAIDESSGGVVGVISTPTTNLFEHCLSAQPIGAVLQSAAAAGVNAVGAADCLNVSSTALVMFYEALRQRSY